MKQAIILLLLILTLVSCKKENEKIITEKSKPNKIVLISVNAPKKNVHLMKQDSVGKKVNDSIGPKMYFINNGFTYLDYLNNVQTWKPKPNVSDTITIETYNDYVELSRKNFFTSIKETFLVKNGDTVIFNYEHNIPKAKITNRAVSDIELNYNHHRLKTLFNNKYTSYFLIFWDWRKAKEHYNQAKQDFIREMDFLDSLKSNNLISQTNYFYRKDALNMLMEKHKNSKPIKEWLEQSKSLSNEELVEHVYSFDLTKTDSLITFSFFRDYLNTISQYDLKFITENNGSSGASYIDSRIRFDSILKDKRFNQTAKNLLLFNAYNGIGQNFRVKDKEKYFKKLQENTTSIEQLDKLKKEFKLDFSKSNELVLTSLKNNTLTFNNLIENNKGKWLYIDFWASWCKPCRITMPESNKLKKELEKENIEFIYLSLNDKKEKWKEAIETDGISGSQNYFIENGNVSKVIEDLGVKSIPHYLIYNPNGELVNGFANRPGQGAKEQLKKLITKN